MINKLCLLALCILIASCSNTPFNAKYANAGWDKIIIAPIGGSLAESAELTFEHELAVTSSINVIPASMVKILLKEKDLIDTYAQEPEKALFLLADKISANGIIFAEVKSTIPSRRNSADLVSNAVEIYAKLVDAKTRTIVAASHQEASAFFSSPNTLVKEVSSESIDEFREVFALLNVN
ncbi:hypothetical protein [Thalassotalea fusca]